jgi:hypothetical protein
MGTRRCAKDHVTVIVVVVVWRHKHNILETVSNDDHTVSQNDTCTMIHDFTGTKGTRSSLRRTARIPGIGTDRNVNYR